VSWGQLRTATPTTAMHLLYIAHRPTPRALRSTLNEAVGVLPPTGGGESQQIAPAAPPKGGSHVVPPMKKPPCANRTAKEM
jgi:hypothetical protein